MLYVVLGNNVSLSFTVTVFNLKSTEGFFLGNGEIKTLVCASFKATYSSNVKVIVLPVTLVLFSPGEARTNRGGILSFGPPVGIPTWPQPALLKAMMNDSEVIKKVKSICFDFINYY